MTTVAEVSGNPPDGTVLPDQVGPIPDSGPVPADTTRDTAGPPDAASTPDVSVADLLSDIGQPPAPDVIEALPGAPGAACVSDEDCGSGGYCWTAAGDGFPGGYCVIDGCEPASCPEGSGCFTFSDDVARCIATCTEDAQCRTGEGYECDSYGTCWPADGAVPPGGSCGTDAHCAGGDNATCVQQEGFVGGYCVIADCQDDCPEGGLCRPVFTSGASGCIGACEADGGCRLGYVCVDEAGSDWDGACYPGCATDADCPPPFACRGNACIDTASECSAENPQGDCPAGDVCHDGVCGPFACAPEGTLEPNETLDSALAVPAEIPPGLQICAGDDDWYTFAPRSAGVLYQVGIDSNNASGDLSVVLTNAAGESANDASIAAASYNEENTVGPTNLEIHGIVGSRRAASFWLHVFGVGGAVNNYGLVFRRVAYEDGPDCVAVYGEAECWARSASGASDYSKLLEFPVGHGADPYVGEGVFFRNGLSAFGNSPYTAGGSLWARRELIMIVRHAIHTVQQTFPGTGPLGIGDIGMPDGTTPRGHPNGTHYGGANIDIAYYIRPELQGEWGNMAYRQICCDAPLDDWGCVDTSTSSAGYGTCVAGSEATHIIDIPRTALLVAKLAGSGRLRVIGLEAKVQADLEEGLQALEDDGVVTAAEHAAALARIATANDDGSWVWHFNHMHASFLTGASKDGERREMTFEGPWPDIEPKVQRQRTRDFYHKQMTRFAPRPGALGSR